MSGSETEIEKDVELSGEAKSTEPTLEVREILRAMLLAADEPLNVKRLGQVLTEEMQVTAFELRQELHALKQELDGTALELTETASGYRLQIGKEYAAWIGRLWDEKPQKFSKAMLETLALIVYRQPITRGEIEEIRGVALSSNILRTMFEREWVREVGHREGPGRPALLATTRQFLDDFNLKSLDDLPSVAEIADSDQLDQILERLQPGLRVQLQEEQSEEESGQPDDNPAPDQDRENEEPES